jgi:hypothetical protein
MDLHQDQGFQQKQKNQRQKQYLLFHPSAAIPIYEHVAALFFGIQCSAELQKRRIDNTTITSKLTPE